MLKEVKKAIKWMLDVMPGRNYIVFESIPDLSDNTKAVFDEMLRRGLHKKYKFCWWVSGERKDMPHFPNTIYIDQKNPWNRFVFWWITLRARCLICCNNFLEAVLPSQKSFYLTHGTALKRLSSYVLPERVSYTLVASEGVKEVMARELKGDISTFYALGYPRNDALQRADRDLHPLLGENFRKVVVWYPTFRQHKSGLRTDAKNALPVLHDTQSAVRLNEIARKNGVLIVVKPHFAQDISYISDYGLSNIKFINDSFFNENNISSYEFVGSCDALITDYSSIYFDYLLCNKPVAVIWEDIEDYRNNPGFAMDADFYMKGAEKIYNEFDYTEFIRRVANGEDLLSEQRAEINALVNYSTDGKNTERVVDFIVQKAHL